MIVNTSNVNSSSSKQCTLPSGLNRYVLFMIGDSSDAYSYYPNTVTIAGVVATMIAQTGAGTQATSIWGACIPDSVAAGLYDIVLDGSSFHYFFTAVFTGVSRDAVVDSDALYISSDSDGNSLTVDCVGGGWVHDIVYTEPAKTAGAGQTVIYNETGGAGVSYKSGLAHGTTTMAWTWTDSRSGHAVVSLRPYRATGGSIMMI